jgi:hypothetical protein
VIAEIQFVTYNEFLPAMGVSLPAYQGYDEFLDPATSHEFATVGYRAHSFIHGEIETETNVSRYSQATLDALEAKGVEVTVDGADVELGIPLNVAFFDPDLVQQVQLGPILAGFAAESDYKNDEMIDNSLRSILFQIPISGNPECLDGPTMPACFQGVTDLGAIDLARGRDHGMPSYNQMRNAYGLASKTSFTAITGESTESFPADPLLTRGNEINDPNCLDIVALFDVRHQRQPDHRGGRQRHPRGQALLGRGPPQGDLRFSLQSGRFYRHDGREARDRFRVGRASTRHVEGPVPQLHPPELRHRLPEDAGSDHRGQHGRSALLVARQRVPHPGLAERAGRARRAVRGARAVGHTRRLDPTQ